MVKRRLSLLLVAVMVFSTMTAFAQSEGFELDTSGWTVDSGSTKVSKPSTVKPESCIALFGRNQRGVWHSLNASGSITFEADVLYQDNTANVKVPEIMAVDAKGNTVAVVSLSILNGQLSAVYSDGFKNTRSSMPITGGKWNKITVEVDGDKDQFSVWINGETVLVNKKFQNNVDAVRFTKVSYSSAGIGSKAYVDNLSFYSGSAKNVRQKNVLSQEDILFDDNFNGTIAKWNMDSTITQVEKPKGTDAGDKALLFAAGVPNKYLSRSFGEISDIVTVEAEIMVETNTKQIKIPDIYVNGNVQGALLSVVGSNISVPYFENGKNVRANIPVPFGTWFKVTIECNPETDKFSVWINGEPFVKNVAFYNGVDVKTISTMRFNVINPEDPKFYVDNVRAYKGPAIIGEAAAPLSLTDYLAKAIVVKKDSNIAYQTNYRKQMSTKPYVEGENLMLPVDEIAKGFYADSGLDTVTNTQFISIHENNIRLTAGLTYFVKNGEKVNVDAVPVLKDGVMYASLKTIDAMLDRDTFYDAATGIVLIAQRGKLPNDEEISSVVASVAELYAEKLLPSAEVYVAVDAEEGGDGSVDTPYATIEDAQAHVKKLLKEGKTGNITVFLREGTYYLSKSVNFDATDSHSGNYTVTYKNYDDERVVIDGGKRLTGWKPYKDGIYTTQLEQGMDFQTLYEDGNRVTIARYPNEGYNRVIMSKDTPKKKFIFKEGDIPVVANPNELKFYMWPGGPGGHYNWSMARPGVASLDYKERLVTLNSEVIYELGTGSRYFTYNALEFLDVPGEFYVDKEKNMIYYKPKNPDIEKATIVCPPTFDLINIKGTETKFAKNIVFEGLEIKSTDLNKSPFMITNAENILISKCQIYNSGHNGVYMRGSVRNSRVENCHIYQMGFYGVFAEGKANTQAMNNYGNSVTNCHIHNIGEMNGNAVGVRFMQTQYCYAANNKVNDSPRNGLHLFGAPDSNLIGKTMEEVKITAENVRDFKVSEYNTIEYNDASRCLQDSQDTNAIGAFGIDWHNVIRKNAVHDNYLPQITVEKTGSFWFPYYFDENSNGSYVVSNLSYDNQLEEGGPMNAAFHNNASKDTKVFNNIFADANYVKGVISVNDMDNAGRLSSRVSIERNIFSGFLNTMYSFSGWNKTTVESIDYNLFHSASGNYLLTGKMPEKTLAEWQKSAATPSDQHSIIGDPMFVSKEKNDYRLKYDSPAYILGFEDINQSDIGLRSDYAFADPNDKLDKLYAYREGDYLKKAWVALEIGDKATLTAAARTVNGYLADNSTLSIKYTSGDASIAKVEPDGTVTAVGKGRCKISVSAQRNGVTIDTEMEIVVGDSKINGINILGIGNSIEIGDTLDIKATAVTEFGKQLKLDQFTLTCDRADATIDNSKITFNGTGEYQLTVTSGADASVSGTIKVEVFKAAFKTIALKLDQDTYNEGGKVGYSYTLIDSKGNEMDGNGAKVTVQGDTEGFVAIENGEAIAKKTGMGTVSLMIEYQGATVVASAKVAIIPKGLFAPEGFTVMNYSPKEHAKTAGFAFVQGDRIHMTTSGNDAWNAEDSCSFMGKPIDGTKKTTVTAKIHEVTTPGSYLATGARAIHAAAGVMIRDRDTADSNNVFVRYRLNGDVVMSYRTDEYRATTYTKGSAPSMPVEVKLEKDGNKFTGSYKDESGQWKVIATIECKMGDTILAGVGQQSGVAGDYNVAQFSDIQIIQ